MFADFAKNAHRQYERTLEKFPKVRAAATKIDNVIVLENSKAPIDSSLVKTREYLDGDAADARGLASNAERTLVVIYENHKKKPAALEGALVTQGGDTVNHELGHFAGNKLSQTAKFKKAYVSDLKVAAAALRSAPDNSELKSKLEYLKHYTQGADFSTPISEKDVTSRGLKEMFAECFSMIADDHPSEINKVFRELFPNSMQAAFELVA